MKYDEEDSLLVNMFCESNEDARDLLYQKYEPQIKRLVNKYIFIAKKLGLEENDLMQEANVGFTDAINHFDEQKDASLKTFIQICIERKLQNYIRKHQSLKYKVLQESLSLDYIYDEEGYSLKEVLPDLHLDPSVKFSEKETQELFLEQVKTVLSHFEYEVFRYLLEEMNYHEIATVLDKSPKQIDNTIQRIRFKLRQLLKEEVK